MPVEIARGGETVVVGGEAWEVEARQPDATVSAASAVIVGGIPYGGSYEVTPGGEAQRLPTASRMLEQDIVVKPVPSNYGLITWDGSTITVS